LVLRKKLPAPTWTIYSSAQAQFHEEGKQDRYGIQERMVTIDSRRPAEKEELCHTLNADKEPGKKTVSTAVRMTRRKGADSFEGEKAGTGNEI